MRDLRPLILIILDGWGLNPRHEGNAIFKALTPNMDSLTLRYPTSEISIAGLDVGLPDGQIGNSEVGHMHLGSGRIVYQALTLIHRAIEDGSFFSNSVFLSALEGVKQASGRLHLMGLLGDGGVHSHQRHMEALIEMGVKAGVKEIYLHLFLDGRDTPPMSGEGFLLELGEKLKSFPGVRIATLCGRYYAMDRDNRWDRTERAYLALAEGIGFKARSAPEAILKSYGDGVSDEFFLPTVIENCYPAGMIHEKDTVFFFNFRADRARQLTRTFIDIDFKEFLRPRRFTLPSYITMTEYDKSFAIPSAYPTRKLGNILGEIASAEGMRQLRIAETEKYAHVTYFFNGGREEKFPLEERILIPSAQEVATYDLKPAMSAYEVTDTLIGKLEENHYGFIILNFANTDMVGHTGNFEAAVKACEVVDECLGRVVRATMKTGGRLVITADHGNAEQMIYYNSGNIHTAHTTNKVPLILVDDELRSSRLLSGTAIDVAPTILSLFGISQPEEMMGHCLIK